MVAPIQNYLEKAPRDTTDRKDRHKYTLFFVRMATVAQPTPISNGTHAQESDQHTEHGPPRFTAVNGKDTTVHNSNTTTSTVSPSQSNENTDLGGVNGNTNGSRQEESQREMFNSSAEQVGEYVLESSPQTSPNGGSKNKRKRSESLERQSQQQGLPSDVQATSARSSELGSEPPMQSESSNGAKLFSAGHEYSGQPSAGYMHAEMKDAQAINGTGGSWQDYDSHLISQAQKAQNLDTSDAQLVEALQRETHSTDSMEQKPWPTGPPSVTGESMSPYTQEKSQTTVQVGPKRKRVFSNRTKTGCLTCRRRKKKCDEQHPACKFSSSARSAPVCQKAS